MPTTHSTKVKFQDGSTKNVNLSELPFLPNGMLDMVTAILAKPQEETCEILYSRSAYGTDKQTMSKEKKGEFKHPVIAYINAKDELRLMYSSTRGNGHFGVPKVVFTKSNVGIDALKTYIDVDGKYGMTEYCIGIADTPENLKKIDECLNSDKFKEFAKYFAFGDNNLNRRVLSLFRKDFWKHFVDANGNVI